MKGPDWRCSGNSALSTPARGQSRRTRPSTYFPNAVLAEVFIVAENDDFAGHGGTDAEPVLNLKSNRREREAVSLVCVLTPQQNSEKNISVEQGLSTSAPLILGTRPLSVARGFSAPCRMLSSNPGLYLLGANGTMAAYDKQRCLQTLPIIPGGQTHPG